MKYRLYRILSADPINTWYDRLREPWRILLFFIPMVSAIWMIYSTHPLVAQRGVILLTIMVVWSTTRVIHQTAYQGLEGEGNRMSMRSLQDYLRSPTTNEWVRFEHARIYVRTTERYIDERCVKVFDLSNIEVADGFRGQGTFKRACNLIAVMADVDFLRIENVLDERLQSHLRGRGFVREPGPPRDSPSFYVKPRYMLGIDK